MRRSIALVFCLLLFVGYDLDGQMDSISVVDGVFVGVSPFALLNSRTALQISLGYGFADRYEVHIDAAYITGQIAQGSYGGMRLRPSLRYYIPSDHESMRLFVSCAYEYWQVTEDIFAKYREFEGQFFRIRDIKRDHVKKAVYLSFGAKHLLRGAYWLDYSVGLGQRTEQISVPQFENSIYVDPLGAGDSSSISVLFSFALGMRF